MNDLSDTAPPKRRRARRDAQPVAPHADAPAEPAVRAILEHALHPGPDLDPDEHAGMELESAPAPVSSSVESSAIAPAPAKRRRPPRKRGKSAKGAKPTEPVAVVVDAAAAPDVSTVNATPPETAPGIAETAASALDAGVESWESGGDDASSPAKTLSSEPAPVEAAWMETGHGDTGFGDTGFSDTEFNETQTQDFPSTDVEPNQADDDATDGDPTEPGHYDDDRAHHAGHVDSAHADSAHTDSAPPSGHGAPPEAAPEPSHHHWVYLGLGIFLLAIGFGVWGAWTVFFGGDDASAPSASVLTARSEKLSQEVSTLRRSDQISRDANRDLERTLAERDEEIAGLRADIAFYESFVGATGQRRGLSVHDLDMRLQSGDAWHFVATLTQNLNRGAVNTGRVTLSIEGTRNDRLEKLTWSGLRKQNNAPGVAYSFKYFQQVEGEVLLPKGFKPLRVGVRLVPAGGSAIEQSFSWPETVRSGEGG